MFSLAFKKNVYFKFPRWSICVCGCCLPKFSNKNQNTDFSFSFILKFFVGVVLIFFFFGARSILWGWQELSELKRYKGVDGKDDPPIDSWHDIKKKGRKWEEEVSIVPLLTFPSNYARVKARVTRKMISVLSHLP